MKNTKTELVFILDRSGSMDHLTEDTIGGFNAMIDRQKRAGGKCLVTTVLFDTRFQRLHDRVPLVRVKPMTRSDYCPGGCTALLDAVGDTIRHISDIHSWQFVFLGANIDAFSAAGDIGISPRMSTNFMADGRGMALGFESVGRAVSYARRSAPIAMDWKADVEADFDARSED